MSKSFVFTINNPTEEEILTVKGLPCQRICAELEKGKEGTPHVQGAVVFKNTKRVGGVCKLLGGRAWVAKMRGTWADQEYCTKDNEVIIVADYTIQGMKTDLLSFKEDVKRGADDAFLIDNHLATIAKYPRFENRLKEHYARERSRGFRKIEVIVHWGDAGTGKTRGPMEEGAFKFTDYDDHWWDGYQGEKVLLLDDFYGGVKWCTLLHWLDGYQVRLKIKGGHTYAQWTKVYITSNKRWDDWYNRDDQSALERRITKVVHYVKFEGGVKTLVESD